MYPNHERGKNNKTTASKMNEFLNKNQILQQLQQQQHYYNNNNNNNKYVYEQQPSSPNSSCSSFQTTHHHKSESLIKSKMKKFINKHSNDNDVSLISSKSSYNTTTIDRPHYKTSQNDSNTIIVSTNNTTDYMMFLPETPVYTETNLPARILRKYQKKALTEKVATNNQDNLIQQQQHQQQAKKQLDESDLVDLAKTIQDIYQIDDDVIDQNNFVDSYPI